MSYTITPYTYEKAKQEGLQILPSNLKTKKIDVYKNGKKIASIGAIGYKDYPSYLQSHGLEYANKRRELFHKRFENDNSLPSLLVKKLLW